MSDKNKEKPTLEVRLKSGQVELGTSGETAFDSKDIITQMPQTYKDTVLTTLMCGESNALTAQEIADILALKDTRTVTRRIERARRSGLPVCATSSSGYYLAMDVGEFSRYVKSLTNRLNNIAETQRHCVDTLNRWTGQETVEGW